MSTRALPCISAAALLVASILPAQDQPSPRIPTVEERAVLLNEGHRLAPPEGPGAQENIDLGDFDVLHYDIDLTVDPTVPRIDGVVLMQAESLRDGLDRVVLDLFDNMEIFSLLSGGVDAVFTRGSNQLDIELDRLYDTGEVFEIEIAYGGLPTVIGLGSFRFNQHGANNDPIVSSLSEPSGGRTWWPSRDVPWDKVTTTMDLTVPEELTAISNGNLLEIVQGTGTRTFRWEETYPIAPYLVSVAVSNYVTWTDTYTGLQGEQMPVSYWVYPEHEDRGREAFNVTVPMIEFFANLWGEYPFLNEKYDQAEFPCWCAMEHQTATTYGHNLIRSDHRYDFVVAHELAHQWWGDLVTLATWDDIWLNEGFASYSEALWFENVGGFDTYKSYMRSMDGNFPGSVYDPNDTFNSTVYNKGAWVLHMLRKVIGDANIFQMFRDWATSYSYDNATTDDLRILAESLYGDDLTWFWDQWIYEPGRPNYRWGWLVNECNGEHTVHTRVSQIQGNRLYQAPLDIRLSHGSGPTTTTEWNTDALTDYYYPMSERVTNVEFDPDSWVLKYSRREILPDPDLDGIIDDFDGCPDSYNPCQEDSDADGLQDACDPDLDDDNDGTNNEEDCSDNDPFVTAPPDGEVRYLFVTKSTGNPYGINWEAFDPGNQAEITYDVIRGRLSDLRADRGRTEDAICLSRMNRNLSTTDGAAPPGGSAHYYLVRPRNSCDGGPYGPPALEGARFTRACQ